MIKRNNQTKSTKCGKRLYVCIFLTLVVLSGWDYGEAAEPRNDLLEKGVFIQIPGPNPILLPGSAGAWDSGRIETADAFKDFGTYHLYYHGPAAGGDGGYQLGVATSKNPLGPFTKYEGNPILKRGEKGSWEDRHAACAMIVKEYYDKYYMFYSGKGTGPGHGTWDIGLATASSPLGPWKKYEKNPIMKNFGYVGGVVQANGKYYLYTEHPIGSTGVDYGPMSVAVAPKPEGPWTEYAGNPVMKQGEWGEWDDGGISEAEVLYHSGVFHCFYGGTKLYRPRIASRESIGYSYSYDGFNWIKYGLNPIVTREANPNAASFSEVHAIFEAPFIYLYHTLRYKEPWLAGDKKRNPPGDEDLGVQVLVTQRPFSLDMPVWNLETLGAGKTTLINNARMVSLSYIKKMAITAECTYSKKAKNGIRLHVVSSPDGYTYDTSDLYTIDNDFKAGQTVRKTVELSPHVKFIKILVENLDKSTDVSNVKIIATLAG